MVTTVAFLSKWKEYDRSDHFPFDSEINQMDIRLIHNQKENGHYDRNPFNMKESN